MQNHIQENVELLRSHLKEYYGRHLRAQTDLKQKACCTDEVKSRYSDILKLIPAEVKEKHYGCGCPVPDDNLKGLTILDLGSGAGVDAFIVSYLAGPEGFVHGIDMTPSQINLASQNANCVMKNFDFGKLNVAFHQEFIESADCIPDSSIDLVISNCVINLSPRKDLVFGTIWRVLKEGGEFYISDIVSDRRLPEKIRNDEDLIAECLGGAEYENDLIDVIQDSGFLDPRIVSRREVQRDVLGEPCVFYSVTMRGFKFAEKLDRRCEDYGQIATYNGKLHTQQARFMLDDHHIFEAHRPTPVCRNTARMLTETRLSAYFNVTQPIAHFGLFPCGPSASSRHIAASETSCC